MVLFSSICEIKQLNGEMEMIFQHPVAHTEWKPFGQRLASFSSDLEQKNQIKAEHDVLIKSNRNERNVSASIQINTTLLCGYGLNT